MCFGVSRGVLGVLEGVREAERDVWRDSVRNEGVRRCLLSVRNVCECLWLHLAMSRICQG